MESTIEKQKNYPKDQDWVYCKDRLPIDGFDDGHYFIVATLIKYKGNKNFTVDYSIVEWNSNGETYPKNDSKRVKTYNFDFDWDIDEGQEIEVVAWREVPEFVGIDGEIKNISRFGLYYEQ